MTGPATCAGEGVTWHPAFTVSTSCAPLVIQFPGPCYSLGPESLSPKIEGTAWRR